MTIIYKQYKSIRRAGAEFSTFYDVLAGILKRGFLFIRIDIIPWSPAQIHQFLIFPSVGRRVHKSILRFVNRRNFHYSQTESHFDVPKTYYIIESEKQYNTVTLWGSAMIIRTT